VVTIPNIATHGAPAAVVYTIDDTHGNPRAAWEAMGKPTYPSPDQINALNAAAKVDPQPLDYQTSGGGITFTVTLVPYATVVAFIPLQYTAAETLDKEGAATALPVAVTAAVKEVSAARIAVESDAAAAVAAAKKTTPSARVYVH
jgi:hypothetical protein